MWGLPLNGSNTGPLIMVQITIWVPFCKPPDLGSSGLDQLPCPLGRTVKGLWYRAVWLQP